MDRVTPVSEQLAIGLSSLSSSRRGVVRNRCRRARRQSRLLGDVVVDGWMGKPNDDRIGSWRIAVKPWTICRCDCTSGRMLADKTKRERNGQSESLAGWIRTTIDGGPSGDHQPGNLRHHAWRSCLV